MPADIEFLTKPALAAGDAHPRPERRVSRPGGSPATRSTAPTPPCAPSWSCAGRLCAGHRLRPSGPHRGRADARRRDHRQTLPRTRLAAALGRARREGPALLRLGLIAHPDPAGGLIRPTRSAGGCWCDATADTGELAFYRCYCTRGRSRCASWSASPDAAGRSRNPSRPARAWPGSTNTRSAAGPPGGAGRCSRCSPTPCSP